MSEPVPLDLSELDFAPDWAKRPDDASRYANYAGDDGRPQRGDRGDRRGPRPGGGRPGGQRPGGQRPGGPGGPGGPRRDFPPRSVGGRPDRDRRDGRGGRGPGQGQRDDRRSERPERPAFEPVRVEVSFLPSEAGIQSLATQIRNTARAYPVFGIARMVLDRPERYSIKLDVPPAGKLTGLIVCNLDGSVWITEDEAARHLLAKHFELYYEKRNTPVDPPKGVYSFVAVCGMSGTNLGPPNYHDYQTKLRQIHSERFSRMPFEMFKSRVKIVRDEAVINAWKEEVSNKTEFVCLNVPDALTLGTRAEVEQHFRQHHLGAVLSSVTTHTLAGNADPKLVSPGLASTIRFELLDQQRHPIKLVNTLCSMMQQEGLRLFKAQNKALHVSAVRPVHLELEGNPVADGVRSIIEFIQAHEDCNRAALLEALAPRPPAPAVEAAAPVEPIPAPAPVEGVEAPAAEVKPPEPAPTPEETALLRDLLWLVHGGHIIEFSNGALRVTRKPAPPKPPKEKKAPAPDAPKAAGVESECESEPESEPVLGDAPEVESAPAPEADAPPTTEPIASDAPPAAPDATPEQQA